MDKVSRIELIGGHPAVDFVNTVGGLRGGADDENLFGYPDLLTWVARAGLLDADAIEALRLRAADEPRRAARAFDRALRFRARLDAVLRAHLDSRGARPGDLDDLPGDLDELRRAYLDALAHAHLQPQTAGYDWTFCRATDTSLESPLWPIAQYAVDLLRSGALGRLAQCGHCRWLFLDTSRNRSRRWCSMGACGSIMKMRRYRLARQQ